MAQQLPDRFVVDRCADFGEIGAENVNEVAHVLRREIPTLHMCREGRRVRQLTRPMKNFLTDEFDARRRPCDRNGKFITLGFELGLLRGVGNLPDNVP